MRSLPSLAGVLCLAFGLFGCSGTSSKGPVGDGGAGDVVEEAVVDSAMPMMMDVEAGPPACVNNCVKPTPNCCENAYSPNIGYCYDMTTNPNFCANEGGAP
jgi:hypothetical protein